MDTMKSAGLYNLRIWKVILFMMAIMLFTACFKNTAWAKTALYANNTFSYYEPSTETYKYSGWGDNEDHFGNGEWSSADYYDTGGRVNGENTKVLYLTKEQVQRWKAGDQIIFDSSDFEIWRSKPEKADRGHEGFTASATLYVTNKDTTQGYSDRRYMGTPYTFTSNNASQYGFYGTTILTLDKTPTVPADAVSLYHIQCQCNHGYGDSTTRNGYYSISTLDKMFSGDLVRNGFTWTHSYKKRVNGNYKTFYESHTADATPYYGK